MLVQLGLPCDHTWGAFQGSDHCARCKRLRFQDNSWNCAPIYKIIVNHMDLGAPLRRGQTPTIDVQSVFSGFLTPDPPIIHLPRGATYIDDPAALLARALVFRRIRPPRVYVSVSAAGKAFFFDTFVWSWRLVFCCFRARGCEELLGSLS